MPSCSRRQARRKSGGSRRTAGFTMVEIVVAIVLMGILAAIAIPRIDVESYKINSAVRSVTSTLLYSQRLAVTLQHDVRVAFDSTNSQLRVHEDANNDGVIGINERVTFRPFDLGVVFGRGTTPAFTIGTNTFNFTRTQGGLPVVVFRRDGTVNESGGFYLTTTKSLAQNNQSRTRAAQLIRGSGRVIWQTYATGTWTRGN